MTDGRKPQHGHKQSRIAAPAIAILVLYVLHQDFWFWRTSEPLVFGVLPIGLAYHVAYMLVTAAVLAWIVRAAWPSHLAHDDENARP